MFRLLKLRPPNGWNAVAWEFAIVTLGVVVALGAQELVQSLHWRREVKETRKALDAEVARNLASFEYRFNQRPCVARRLSELQQWADSHRIGSPITLRKEITAPAGYTIRSAVWEVTDGEIATRIPLEAKMHYAQMYDAMKSFGELRESEEEQWIALQQLQDTKRLAADELRTVAHSIRLLRAVNEVLTSFRVAIDRSANELKVSSEKDVEAKSGQIIAKWNRELCKPLL